MTSGFLFKNLELLDPRAGALKSGHQVLIQDGKIAAVAKGAIEAGDAQVIDLGGRTLMPGLIDCHVHVYRTIMPITGTRMLPSFVTARAAQVLNGMLMSGFTTVRDAGGADAGHRLAVEQGLIDGPRLFVGGRAISQTGGHGDSRSPADLCDPCACSHLFPGMGRIADGVDEVRRAVRDEIRIGADHIKVMAGGGVSTQSDPLDQLQYSMEELQAVVDEAERSHTYVMAHVYTDEGIRRCVEVGVRTVEHGSFLNIETARKMATAGTFLVPNLITYECVLEDGPGAGLSAGQIEKARLIHEAGPKAIEAAMAAGVRIAFGTDLAWRPDYQSAEFVRRTAVQKPCQIIESATVVGAEVVRMSGKLGEIVAGAIADLIAVNGDPLADISLLSGQGKHMPLIVARGRIAKNALV